MCVCLSVNVCVCVMKNKDGGEKILFSHPCTQTQEWEERLCVWVSKQPGHSSVTVTTQRNRLLGSCCSSSFPRNYRYGESWQIVVTSCQGAIIPQQHTSTWCCHPVLLIGWSLVGQPFRSPFTGVAMTSLIVCTPGVMFTIE